jgi:hypothetical protein
VSKEKNLLQSFHCRNVMAVLVNVFVSIVFVFVLFIC